MVRPEPKKTVMHIVRSSFVVAVFATFPPVLLIAQSPAAAREQLGDAEQKSEPVLVSAKPLLDASLWHLVAPKKGEAEKLEEVGVIRDFVIEGALGRFESIVVEPKPGSAIAKTRLLSMRKVRWDATRSAMLTDFDQKQVEELPNFVKKEHVLVGKEPSDRRAYLLSELRDQSIACCMPGDEIETLGKLEKENKERKPTSMHIDTVWFKADGSNEAAFAAISVAAKVRLLPYALLRMSCHDGNVCVATSIKEGLVEAAPEFVASQTQKQPGDTLRHQVWQHYGVAVPEWDVTTSISEASMQRR